MISLLVARLVWPQRLAWLPIAGAALGTVLFVGGLLADSGNPNRLPHHAGIAQRAGILAINGGVVLLAFGLLTVASRARKHDQGRRGALDPPASLTTS
ncbi:MAG: hypothetical protein E6G56_04390 [Actinobacteria bacterium]|nr:MAG: hypothetical protein E6G56_04390 [Actinomycetota bacterium]